MSSPLVISSLSLTYGRWPEDGPPVLALDDISLTVDSGETLALVGESGSGKTSLLMAIGQLLPENTRRLSGRILINGSDPAQLDAGALRELRSRHIAYVFQDPMSALDPTRRIKAQRKLTKDTRDRFRHLLQSFGITEINRVLQSFPHQLSGGLAQRVLIALAMALGPSVILADEPTASLDSSTRGQVIDELLQVARESGSSVVIATHDLVTTATLTNRCAVMYAGRIIETGRTADILESPAHHYTAGLLAAIPPSEPDVRINGIPGLPPLRSGSVSGCVYEARCPHATQICRQVVPPLVGDLDHLVACHHPIQLSSAS